MLALLVSCRAATPPRAHPAASGAEEGIGPEEPDVPAAARADAGRHGLDQLAGSGSESTQASSSSSVAGNFQAG